MDHTFALCVLSGPVPVKWVHRSLEGAMQADKSLKSKAFSLLEIFLHLQLTYLLSLAILYTAASHYYSWHAYMQQANAFFSLSATCSVRCAGLALICAQCHADVLPPGHVCQAIHASDPLCAAADWPCEVPNLGRPCKGAPGDRRPSERCDARSSAAECSKCSHDAASGVHAA